MTVISIVAPPPNAPQVHIAVPAVSVTQGLIDPVEQRILMAVRSSEPIHIWKLLNRLVEEEAPSSRHEVRRRKLGLWESVNRLLRQQMLFRAGRHAVTTTKPSPGLAICRYPARRRRKAPTVSHRAKVVIGILDPNQGVCGKGVLLLQRADIEVELFPHDLAVKILRLNEDFVRAQQSLGIKITEPQSGKKIPKQLASISTARN